MTFSPILDRSRTYSPRAWKMGEFNDSTTNSITDSDGNTTIPSSSAPEETLSHGVLIPAAIIFTIECIIGVVGNMSVIVAVTLSRRLQTITNVFVVTLACLDIVSAFMIPIEIGAMFGALNDHDIACAVTGAMGLICNGGSMIALIVIAFNRYFLITQCTQRYRRVFTRIKIVFINISILAYPTALVLLFALPEWATFGMNVICQIVGGNVLKIIVCASSGFMMIVIVFFYSKIFLYVRKNAMTVRNRSSQIDIADNTSGLPNAEAPGVRNKRHKEDRGQRDRLESKITQNMISVVICFFVCCFPITLTYIPRIYFSPTVVLYFFVIFSLRCCLNPLIYAWKHPVFRQVFGCMLSRDLRSVEQPSRWLRERISSW